MSAHRGIPQFRPRPRPDTSWQEHAACVDFDPEIWFKTGLEATAVAICHTCPVRTPCTALGRGQRVGVWGGRVHGTTKTVGTPRRAQ